MALQLVRVPFLQAADIDFFTDSFPSFDVITMGMILHDWGPRKKQMLVQKVCMHTRCAAAAQQFRLQHNASWRRLQLAFQLHS